MASMPGCVVLSVSAEATSMIERKGYNPSRKDPMTIGNVLHFCPDLILLVSKRLIRGEKC